MRRKEERSLQKMCVRWFRLTQKEALIFAVPNGGIKKNDHYMNAVEYCIWGIKEYLDIMI